VDWQQLNVMFSTLVEGRCLRFSQNGRKKGELRVPLISSPPPPLNKLLHEANSVLKAGILLFLRGNLAPTGSINSVPKFIQSYEDS
jgi:hypothetical protein